MSGGFVDSVAEAQWAERALLGALLYEASRPLPPLLETEFSMDRHRDLWRVYLDLEARGTARDIGIICDRTSRAVWRRDEAIAFIAILFDEAVNCPAVEEYARAVRAHATRRAVHDLGVALQRQGFEPEEIEERLRAMPGPLAPAMLTASDGWAVVQSRWGQSHIATGIRALDKIVDGLIPGKLLAVGGRPSHGKTALMLNRALHFAKAGVPVEIISLEETHGSITARLIANETGYMLRSIIHGDIENDAHQLEMAQQAAQRLDVLPIRITTAESLKSMELAAIMSVVRRTSAPIVMIDYIQKIVTDDDSRAYGIERILNALHQAAIQQNIVVWVNMQLNREIEGRNEGKKRFGPQLSDLRDSGASEIVPRQVWLLYWPYQQHRADDPMEYLIRVAKNSDGGTGDASVRYDARCGRFTDEGTKDETVPEWVTE